MTRKEIELICSLYDQTQSEVNKKYQGKENEYNPHLNTLCEIALRQGQGQSAAHDFLHKEITELVVDKLLTQGIEIE